MLIVCIQLYIGELDLKTTIKNFALRRVTFFLINYFLPLSLLLRKIKTQKVPVGKEPEWFSFLFQAILNKCSFDVLKFAEYEEFLLSLEEFSRHRKIYLKENPSMRLHRRGS